MFQEIDNGWRGLAHRRAQRISDLLPGQSAHEGSPVDGRCEWRSLGTKSLMATGDRRPQIAPRRGVACDKCCDGTLSASCSRTVISSKAPTPSSAYAKPCFGCSTPPERQLEDVGAND